MNKEFLTDYYRMTGNKFKFGFKSIINCLFSHQIRYMYWWRKANKRRNVLLKLILYKYSRKYGLEIASTALIGEGLYLGHPYNITIGGDVRIGKNVNLHKGCTIGRENRGIRKGSPKIGNNVAIGINSTIVGNITIGDDVIVAPNSFINFDVPPHSVVVGNPATIHKKENASKGYVNFCI